MSRPTKEQLDTAIEWLRCNEGSGGENECCAIVADWLEKQEQDAFLRSQARKAGVPVGLLRKRLNG